MVSGPELILAKLIGPAVGRAAGAAAIKTGGFLYSSWKVRSKARKTRLQAVRAKELQAGLLDVPSLLPEVASSLVAYLQSPDLADICLKLAIELAPQSTKSKGQLAEASAVKAELLASLTTCLPTADQSTTEIICSVVFGLLVEHTVATSSLHTTPESVHPELRGIAVATAARAAEASLRNTELLRRLGSVAEVWKFEGRLRDQVRALHGSMKLPHAGTTRKVPYRQLFVEPSLIKLTRDEESSQPEEPTGLNDVLFTSPRTVILGNPGGGKSTLALKFTYDVARSSVRGAKPTVPLLVVLRDYAESFKSEKQTLVSYLEGLCRAPYNIEPPPGAIEYLLLNGRAFVVFDGLDELTDISVRRQLVQSVESFANLYPTASILVTSREVGYEQAPLDSSIFATVSLAPLGSVQVLEYAKKWFSLDESVDKQRRQELAAAFISDSQYVADLRTNPLMLSLMCGIYSSEHYIPANRPEVYRKCAELLFEKWDKQRGIFTPLPFDAHVRLALNALAFWMYSTPGLQKGLTRDALTKFMTRYLLEKRFEDEAEAENAAVQFVDFCTGRAWVLTDVGSNVQQELYGFTHRTFLEFFAANQLVRLNASAPSLFSALAEKLAEQEWDVVAQLSLQILGNNVEDGSDDFLALLLDASERESNLTRRASLSSFAVRSLSFIVPRPILVSRIVHSTIDSLYEETDEENGASKPRPFRHLLQCSKENLPSVARALRDDVRCRLEADPKDDFALMIAVFVGQYQDDLLGQIDPGRAEFWRNEQKQNLAEFHDVLEMQALEYAWVDMMRATLGEVAIGDVIARHGVRALFVYLVRKSGLRAPFAYRWWVDHRSDWHDAEIAKCVAQLPEILTSLPTPWVDLADPEVFAMVRAMSNGIPSRNERDDRRLGVADMLMAMPAIEGIPSEIMVDLSISERYRHPSREGRTFFHSRLSALIHARRGESEARETVVRYVRKATLDPKILEFFMHWMDGYITLSHPPTQELADSLRSP